MSMKKCLSYCVIFVMMALIICPAFCSVAAANTEYKVTLVIRFYSNLIFSKYDVDLVYKNTTLAHLSHGQDFSGSFYADEGRNNLVFYKSDDHSVKGIIDFDVHNDTIISCNINCHRDKIELDEVNIKTDNSTKKQAADFREVDLSSMSDEELLMAAEAIQNEQKSRIKASLVLDQYEIHLYAGDSLKLTGNIINLPDGEQSPLIEWSSSDNSVATVHDGLVSALSGGDAVISCNALFQSGARLSAECVLNVDVKISSLKADRNSADLMVGESFSPAISIEPDDASYKELLFESEDPGIAEVNSEGLITGIASGTTVINVTAADESESSTSVTVTVKNNSYLESMSGRVYFDKVLTDEEAENVVEGGFDDWYDFQANICGISLIVHSRGKDGAIICIEVMGTGEIQSQDFFVKAASLLFSGEDTKKATDWLAANLGNNEKTQIGDAYIILQVGEEGAPIMYITDEEHMGWL